MPTRRQVDAPLLRQLVPHPGPLHLSRRWDLPTPPQSACPRACAVREPGALK